MSTEGFRVHLGCGTVLELEGLEPTGPQLAGQNEAQTHRRGLFKCIAHAGEDLMALNSEAAWLEEQRRILEQLTGRVFADAGIA